MTRPEGAAARTGTAVVELIGMTLAGEHRHASVVLREMGVRYSGWEGQPIADQIKLTGVELDSLPEKLPDWLRVF